ncbi:MAG: hypothetical protein DRJ57_03150 [Thermoprotei archaeon]|nr:MAG: hypothetical protein DRJ57_03150 [Thermoprotei archaeon]
MPPTGASHFVPDSPQRHGDTFKIHLLDPHRNRFKHEQRRKVYKFFSETCYGIAMKIAESRVSKRYLVSLPRAVRTALGLDVGDVIEWHVEDGKIVVKKKSR